MASSRMPRPRRPRPAGVDRIRLHDHGLPSPGVPVGIGHRGLACRDRGHDVLLVRVIDPPQRFQGHDPGCLAELLLQQEMGTIARQVQRLPCLRELAAASGHRGEPELRDVHEVHRAPVDLHRDSKLIASRWARCWRECLRHRSRQPRSNVTSRSRQVLSPGCLARAPAPGPRPAWFPTRAPGRTRRRRAGSAWSPGSSRSVWPHRSCARAATGPPAWTPGR